jgi:phosphoribosylformylglycinamidine synthase
LRAVAASRALILRAAGTNCDFETQYAFEKVGARAERVHINRLIEEPRRLADYQILCIPGGFTYGDDIAAGRILANQLRQRLGEELGRFQEAGKLILGICNGFQVLVKLGMLPGLASIGKQQCTLTANDSNRYEDRWVYLAVEGESPCVFTQGGPRPGPTGSGAGPARIYLPVAHGEGKFVPADESVLAELLRRRLVVFRYVDARGRRGAYPVNPNGSVDDIAGICDPSGRVLGLMPHPERHLEPYHHPRWTREGLKPEGDGVAIFRNAVRFFD